MRRWPNVGLLLTHRPRRWPNSKPTMGQRFMFAGRAQIVNSTLPHATAVELLPSKNKTFITFVQRRPNVFDVGPTLYKCYKHV